MCARVCAASKNFQNFVCVNNCFQTFCICILSSLTNHIFMYVCMYVSMYVYCYHHHRAHTHANCLWVTILAHVHQPTNHIFMYVCMYVCMYVYYYHHHRARLRDLSMSNHPSTWPSSTIHAAHEPLTPQSFLTLSNPCSIFTFLASSQDHTRLLPSILALRRWCTYSMCVSPPQLRNMHHASSVPHMESTTMLITNRINTGAIWRAVSESESVVFADWRMFVIVHMHIITVQIAQ